MSEEGNPLSPDPGRPLPWFWQIIEAAAGDRRRLREQLEPLNRGSLNRFIWTLEGARTQLGTDEVRLALAPQASEDGMSDLGEWIISRGESYFQKVLADPRSVEAPASTPRSPGFMAEAYRVYQERYGKDPPPSPL
jgi:hypothetical protein